MYLFLYPQVPKSKGNPYSKNFENSLMPFFRVIKFKNARFVPQTLQLMIMAFRADFFIINWLESVSNSRFGGLQAFIGIVALYIIRFRRKRILWVFHNIHPHHGEDFWSRIIQQKLFSWSSLIVSHSQEAEEYANAKGSCPVYYRIHPVTSIKITEWKHEVPYYDVLIWGRILPYKGIIEFISHPLCKKYTIKVMIIGECNDSALNSQILKYCSQNITYQNRCAEFSEIAALCKKAKYVLFPYVGKSISSSGVLIDTIQMGGVPVGPYKGAFADMEKLGCCLTYKSYDDLFNLIVQDEQIKLSTEKKEQFIKNNSWEAFGLWIKTLITNE